MRAHLATTLAISLAACTPPRVYEEGYEPPPPPGGVAYGSERGGSGRGTLSGAAGPASGGSGIAFFATQNQMYQALAALIGGPIAQGARTYRGLEVTRQTATGEGPHALETLQARAQDSVERSAREEGCFLVSVGLNRGPDETDGSFLLRVTSLLESREGVRHREVRDAVVRPTAPGGPLEIRWLGPPRLELRKD